MSFSSSLILSVYLSYLSDSEIQAAWDRDLRKVLVIIVSRITQVRPMVDLDLDDVISLEPHVWPWTTLLTLSHMLTLKNMVDEPYGYYRNDDVNLYLRFNSCLRHRYGNNHMVRQPCCSMSTIWFKVSHMVQGRLRHQGQDQPRAIPVLSYYRGPEK